MSPIQFDFPDRMRRGMFWMVGPQHVSLLVSQLQVNLGRLGVLLARSSPGGKQLLHTPQYTPHANTQPLKFACWHCFPLALRQSRAFCLLLLERQAQRGSSFPAHHCNTVPLHSNCTYHATKALARTAAHHTLASQPPSMQHSMQQKPSGGSKENTTALKVPRRSLSLTTS